jgi:hypothetical protein
MKEPEVSLQIYSQLIFFNSNAKNTQEGKESLFNKWNWQN